MRRAMTRVTERVEGVKPVTRYSHPGYFIASCSTLHILQTKAPKLLGDVNELGD